MKKKPYNLLLWTGFTFILITFLVINQNSPVDIHLHDTYFVIGHTYIFWLLATLALFVWILYLVTNRILYSTTLTWVHTIITILTLLLLTTTLFISDNFMNTTPRQHYDFSNWESPDNYTTFTKAIRVTIIVLLFGQIIFIINFIVGLLKKLTNRKN